MKTAALFLIVASSLLTACASDQPKPGNVTYNNAPANTPSVPTPGVATSAQTATGNTFYTAPVTTPMR
jgi:outer membrane biogenesis lipoprotein LolB